MLSSEPDTIHWYTQVKGQSTQDTQVKGEIRDTGVIRCVRCLPSLQWLRSWRRCSTSHSYGRCMSSNTDNRQIRETGQRDGSEGRVRGTGQRDGSERQTVPFLCCSPRASVCCKTKNTESVTVSGSLLAWAPVPSESNRADVKVQWTLNSHRQKKIHSEDTLWTTNSC